MQISNSGALDGFRFRITESNPKTIMPGHISLPDYQGHHDNPDAAPPATMCDQLLTKLLRQELGYTGLIVSNSTSMAGLTSRVTPSERIVGSLATGIDLYLGTEPETDLEYIKQGVAEGRLTEERVVEIS